MVTSTNGNESKNDSGKEAEPKTPQIHSFRMPTMDEIRAQEVWDNCAIRSVASAVMGGGFGLAIGMFISSQETPLNQDEMTGRQQFKYNAKLMVRKSWHSCKTFAVMGLIFSAAECIVEKARAKHDVTNAVVAGCVTGGSLSAKGGPKAACAGCAGFAAFSALIEKFLERHT